MTKDEKPIAAITFKHKNAQRKFIEREVWDRLKQNSPLYNGDTIRTAELSEAIVRMIENDEDSIELYENSIIQIFSKNGQLIVDVASGGVTVKASSATVKVRIGGTLVDVEAGSTLSATVDGRTAVTNVHLLDGHALVATEDGKIEDLFEKRSVFFEKGDKDFLQKVSSIPFISVSSPLPNEKILSLDSADISVLFKWKVENLTEDDSLILDFSNDRNFTEVTSFSLENLSETQKIIPHKNTYWRIYSKKTGPKYAAQSKINIVEASPVTLLVPANKYKAEYFSDESKIKFSWIEQKWASSYLLKIASKEDMQNPEYSILVKDSSIILPKIPDGNWFWKIVPLYADNIASEKTESEVREFSIQKKDGLASVKLLYPPNKSQIETFESKTLNFSWKNISDAKEYTLELAGDPEFMTREFKIKSSENYCTVDLSQLQKYQKKNAPLFWKVYYTNLHGKTSDDSKVNSFTLAPKRFSQKLIFPPENYKIESARLQDVTFSWKTNATDKKLTKVEFSSSDDFKNLLPSISKSATSCILLEKLSEGTYYWRISTQNEGKTEYSEARTFFVQSSFKAPKSKMDEYVQDGEIKVGVQDGENVHFSWESIQNADSYRFKIFEEENTNQALFENNSVKGNKLDLDLSSFKTGKYIWTVQANSEESELSTRFSGELSKNKIEIRKLGKIELLSPLDGEAISETIFDDNAGTFDFNWQTDENNIKLVFTLGKVLSNGKVQDIKTVENAESGIKSDVLESGNYVWKLEGKTSDGYDLKSAEQTFSIKKRPNLEKPVLVLPKPSKVFKASELAKTSAISFSWKPVKNASYYIITIRKGKKKIVSKNTGTSTNYKFTNLKLLSNGTFTWQVEAVQKIERNKTTLKSQSPWTKFRIDLPALDSIKLSDTGELYGL